ncbi:hypothetical protein CN975_25330, partial [Bacillus cereus]
PGAGEDPQSRCRNAWLRKRQWRECPWPRALLSRGDGRSGWAESHAAGQRPDHPGRRRLAGCGGKTEFERDPFGCVRQSQSANEDAGA